MTWEGVIIFLTQFGKVNQCSWAKKYSKYSLWEEVAPLGIRATLNNFPWRHLASPGDRLQCSVSKFKGKKSN